MEHATESKVADAFECAVGTVLAQATTTVLLRMELEQLRLSQEIESLKAKSAPQQKVKRNGNGKPKAAPVKEPAKTSNKDPFAVETKDLD